ncbi:MAG: hypothetical protein IKO05_12290 [Selenomonadaceae bacterium]|nr:hypothetical protein [Selenomonadaceae bacterium]
MKKFLTAIFAAGIFFGGCGENSQASVDVKEVVPVKNSITVQVNGKNFSATLADNQSAKNFSALLPLEADMTELNGNEKYFYLEKNLPSDSASVKQIHAGDLMLFGSNCVVIFYKDFATSYSYTRLGKIDSPNDLEKILGAGNVRVKFFGGE